MASSRRTYDTDVITLRTVFAKNPGNSNVPALRTLTADGQGGTFWAVPSTLGVNPSFNQIITTAGTYTADLSYNTFRLTAAENIGMTDGPPGSNQTFLYAKAFSQFDVSGENSIYAFVNNQLDSSVTLAGQGGITLRADPATNTLFFVGPASNTYVVSTGIYGFNQIKVVDAASTITSSIQGWQGNFLTATSPSTLLNFIGYNDIQMSTNVTTNSVFFTISTFTSKGYLDISANAYGAYPSTLSTVSSLYVQQTLFNSTIAYLSSYTGFGFSSVVSSINALAMSTGDQFYILTGLINARATIIQLNSEISNVNTNIQSTSVGLGTLGYISTGGGGAIGSLQLISTVEGLGSAGYLSTSGGGAGDVTKANLISTVEGLGTVGYVSSLSTITTSSIFNTGAISTYSLEVFGPATLTNSGSTILRGPIYLGGPTFVAGSFTGLPNTVVSPANLNSTVQGLGTARYISSTQLLSTVRGLGSLGYLSTLAGFTVSSGNLTASSLNLLDPFTNAINYLTMSSGSLLVNGAKIEGGGGGGNVAQIVAGTGISVSPAGGTGVVTVTNTGASISYVDTAISSFSTALGPVSGGGGGGSYNFSTVSSVYGSTFVTNLLLASTMTSANILPSQSNLWVAVGYGTVATNSIQTSLDGLTWTDIASGGFSDSGKGVAYNGTYWIAVGSDTTPAANIQYSGDGKNWSNSVSGGFSSAGNGIAWNGTIWVAVGSDTGTASIQYSRDGRNWSNSVSGGFSTRGESVVWNGSYWVAAGVSGTGLASLQYSLDGSNWISASSGGFSSGARGIAWNGSFWVAAGTATGTASIQYSGDGRNWSNSLTGGFSSSGWRVAWNGRLWVAVGDDSTALKSIQFSIDGSNWSDIQTGGFTAGNDGYGIAWNGSFWVAAGIGASATNSLQRSTDGINWTTITSGGFNSGGLSVGFSSNLRPGYAQQNLTILSQNIPLFLNSTNQIMAQPSSLLLNNLLVDTQWKRVGVNCNTPAFDLDVNGIGHFLTMSSLGLNVSSLNGARYNDPTSITSTVAGLGQNYVSTASLVSTVGGLAASGIVYQSNLISTTYGLQTSGFLSTPVMTSTVAGLGQNYVSTASLISTVGGLAASGIVYQSNLISTTVGLQTSGFLSTPVMTSTVGGLGQNYVSTTSLLSTVAGLGQNYVSTVSTVNVLSSLAVNASSITAFLMSSLAINASSITAPVLSSFAMNVSTINGIPFGLPGYPSTVSTNYALAFNTSSFTVSSMNFVNLRQTTTNLWVATGFDTTSNNRIKYSYDGINWSNSSSGTFNGWGRAVAWNGRAWITVGYNAAKLGSIRYSTDGVNWSANTTGGFTQAYGVGWNGTQWVTVGNNGGFAGSIQYSSDAITWSSNGAGGFTNIGYGVAWNGLYWVAVGDNGNTAGSIQINLSNLASGWLNSSNGGFSTRGLGIAWNGKLWVAVGNNSSNATGSIKYSTDGSNWSNNARGGFATEGTSVAWNGRLWVAVGNNGAASGSIQYSGDGISWSNNSNGGFTAGASVSWNGLYWVAVGTGTTAAETIQYSSDGINWTNSSSGGFDTNPTYLGSGIAYSSNLTPSYNQTNFEIESQNIPNFISRKNQLSFLTSTMILNNTVIVDTTNRVGINTGTPQTDLDVAGIGRFQTLSTFAMNLSTINGVPFGIPLYPSTVSTNYALAFNTSSFTVSSMNFVNLRQSPTNLWVAVGSGSSAAANIQYSTDGINWTNSSTGSFATQGYGVVWNGRLWVAVGNSGGGAASIKYSADGSNWTNSSTGGFSTEGRGVAWNGRLWVAVGSGGSTAASIKYSADGINWTNSSTGGFSTNGYSVAWNGRLWVAVGQGGTTIQYSTDGINWTGASSGTFSSYGFGVAWNGRLWVAVGGGGSTAASIKYSADGINWINSSTGGFSTQGLGIAWNGRMWVAVGYGGTTVQYSTDGINWTGAASGTFSTYGFSVAWNGSLWVAVGNNGGATGSIKYSTDGINWTNSSTGGFSTEGNGAAYSANPIPSYNQTNFEIESQNIPNFLTSTNQLSFLPSTIILNNTLTVDTTNRVGINNGSPQSALDVNGCLRISSIFIAPPTTGRRIALWGSNQTAAESGPYYGIEIQTSELRTVIDGTTKKFTWGAALGGASFTEQMALSNGRLGINATAPAYTLDVGGQSRSLYSTFLVNGNYGLAIASGGPADTGSANATSIQGYNIGAGTTANLHLQPTGGNLGVGITTGTAPSYTLDVNGITRLQSTFVQNNSLTSQNTTGSDYTAADIGLFGGTATSVGGYPFYGPHIRSVIPTGFYQDQMRLDITTGRGANDNTQVPRVSVVSGPLGGFVGINTSSPSYTLDVNGSSRISSLIVGIPTTNPSTSAFLLNLTRDSATKPLTTTWTASSDQRVKENITDADYDRCYDDVKALKLRRFTWASTFFNEVGGYDKRVLGFIAQEVSTIVPKAVTITEANGFSNFQFLNVDQLNMSLYGAVKKTIIDKEFMESTIKGQEFTIQTLMGTQSSILSTLNGLQGR